jgi:hypothetical protein
MKSDLLQYKGITQSLNETKKKIVVKTKLLINKTSFCPRVDFFKNYFYQFSSKIYYSGSRLM